MLRRTLDNDIDDYSGDNEFDICLHMAAMQLLKGTLPLMSKIIIYFNHPANLIYYTIKLQNQINPRKKFILTIIF